MAESQVAASAAFRAACLEGWTEASPGAVFQEAFPEGFPVVCREAFPVAAFQEDPP